MKSKIKLLSLSFVLILSLLICGCANKMDDPQSSDAAPSEEQKTEEVSAEPEKPQVPINDGTVTIEEIEWFVNKANHTFDFTFDYTNNSELTVLKVELYFTPQQEYAETLRDNFKVTAVNYKCAEPGENVQGGDVLGLDESEQYDMVSPLGMNISYIGNDGKKYDVAYDYATGSCVDKSNGEELFPAFSGVLGTSIPYPPEGVYLTIIWDNDTDFWCTVSGTSTQMYASYVSELKANGFTDVVREENELYESKNSDGMVVMVGYEPQREEYWIKAKAK